MALAIGALVTVSAFEFLASRLASEDLSDTVFSEGAVVGFVPSAFLGSLVETAFEIGLVGELSATA